MKRPTLRMPTELEFLREMDEYYWTTGPDGTSVKDALAHRAFMATAAAIAVGAEMRAGHCQRR